MTYINDLDTLEIDSYDHAELQKLAKRIVNAIGSDQAWEVMESIADKLHKENAAVVIAARFNPDDPNIVDSFAVQPATKGFDAYWNKEAALLANIALLSGDLLLVAGKSIGMGPAGTMELFHKTAMEVSKKMGRGGGGEPFIFGSR